MATKKQPEPTQPKVSKLPLPISDSPLVIDLPDGQKIVVGKMTNGSVIEVATWRGVGRPDSRTSRLMLGVGNGNVDEVSSTNANSEQEKSTSRPKGAALIGYYFEAALKFTKESIFPLIRKLVKDLNSQKKRKKIKVKDTVDTNKSLDISTPETTKGNINSEVDKDVQEWLDRISKDAIEKSRKSSKTAKAPKKTGPNSSARPLKTTPKKK